MHKLLNKAAYSLLGKSTTCLLEVLVADQQSFFVILGRVIFLETYLLRYGGVALLSFILWNLLRLSTAI